MPSDSRLNRIADPLEGNPQRRFIEQSLVISSRKAASTSRDASVTLADRDIHERSDFRLAQQLVHRGQFAEKSRIWRGFHAGIIPRKRGVFGRSLCSKRMQICEHIFDVL